MPSTSAKQAKFMRAVAHSPKFAKKVGVSQSVGKDFEMADKKMKKFGSGGTSTTKPKPPLRPAPGTNDPDYEDEGVMKMKPPAKPPKPVKKDPDTLGVKKLAKGGSAMKKMMSDKMGRAMKKKSADTMGRAMMNKGGKCYAKGGSASARADGIAKKGKTRGKVLSKGGMC